MPECGISKTLYRSFPWSENGVEQWLCLFFASSQVKFQSLKVCCADSIVIGKTAVTGFP